MTTSPVKSLIEEQVCEACQGEGRIDQRIGGHAFSGIADCPDCNDCGAATPITCAAQLTALLDQVQCFHDLSAELIAEEVFKILAQQEARHV